jgi:hypothetical protein
VLATVPGLVWDRSGTRTLYVDTTSTTWAVKIADGADGHVVTVPGASGTTQFDTESGYLDPAGATFLVPTAAFPRGELMDWRDGVLSSLGGASSFRAAGTWAAWDDPNHRNLARLDLLTGTTTAVEPSPGSYDVAADGTIAFASGNRVFLDRGGVATLLPGQSGFNALPRTDGQLTVYSKLSGNANDASFAIAINDGTGETVLTPADLTTGGRGWSYAVAGGQAAYLKRDSSQQMQVWRHGPSGEEQLTHFADGCLIDAMAPDGTIILHTRTAGRLYRALPGQAPQDVGAAFGPVVYRDGGFVEIVDSSALAIGP